MRAKNHILQSIIVCGKLELQNKTEDKKMAYSIDVAAARALATKAHEGQTDKAGLPYITHPERVALRMESPELQVIGWLHDTVEDTGITVQDITEHFDP
jgi:(p)ppGpp synthase/HD superfamily hydrolase